MDRFLNIDWNPPLEDILDNTFINEERLEKESVMYRIMNGNFLDPFMNIEEDYKNVNINLIKNIDPSLKIEDEEKDEDNDGAQNQRKNTSHVKQIKNTKCYVPGIVKPIFKFPKRSKLNKIQHAMCLRVLLKFSESDKPKLSQSEREELQNYLDLQHIISQEQNEFLEFAKSKWHERSFKVVCEDYINLCWKSKVQNVYKLPRYYTEVTNIPFVADRNVEVKFISDCLQMGELPKIALPSFTRQYMLRINSDQLQKRFPPEKKICGETSVQFKLPVSEDPNCQELAENNNVDLVISSSGLNCLVNNIEPSYSNSWILPVVIKKHSDKNTIYIDKPMPPVASNVTEKNNWVYKYILKYFLIPAKHQTSKSTKGNDDDIFDNANAEELLRIEDEYENTLTQIDNTLHSNVIEKNKNFEDILEQQDLKSDISYSKSMPNSKICPTNIATNFIPDSQDSKKKVTEAMLETNVSYKLFTIGPQLSEQNELMKDVLKEYKILVRTKTDGFEVLDDKVRRLLLLAPKLEYQTDLGAEAVTLQESLKQWISLIFRPHTFLARVRISAKTSEVLQIEHRTAMSISNEIKRLYNIKVENSLTVLHNVIHSLMNLTPGHYIIRHTVRNGAFADVYKEAESPGKNVFDLRTVYVNEFYNLLNPPWIPLDKTISTPMHKYFEIMPAMFLPSNNKVFLKTEKSTKAKSNSETIRRSSRHKKKKLLFNA